MIDLTTFLRIKDKYGFYASWAVWAEEGQKPKDNMGDMSIFDMADNSCLLPQLNPDVVLVGLNISRGAISVPFRNFHDPRPEAMDFKIRYAVKGTPLWGAYMTDIIKDFEEKVSGKVTSYLRANPECERENIRLFREELHDLGAVNPVLIAFGNLTHAILARNLKNEYDILRLPHYSMYVGKEKYRDAVRQLVESDYRRIRPL